MRVLLLAILLCVALPVLEAQTPIHPLTNSTDSAELFVSYYTKEINDTSLNAITGGNIEWTSFNILKTSLSPSDKNVIWFKLQIINNRSIPEKLLLVIPSFTRSDIWIQKNDDWTQVYNGGILQGKKGQQIRPDYEEIIPVIAQPGQQYYLLRVKYNLQRFNPLLFHLLSPEDNIAATHLYQSGGEIDKLFQFAFFIVLLFQLLFIITQSFFIQRIEYIYYIIYIIILGFYFLSKGEFLMNIKIFYQYFPSFNVYFDHSVAWFSAFVYYRFARSFINLPVTDPILNRSVIVLEYFILIFSLSSFIFSFASEYYVLRENIYVVFSGLMTLVTLAIIYRFLSRRVVLYNFAIVGSLLITLGSFLSILAYKSGGIYFNGISLHPISIFQTSVVLELLCFTTGLAYKSRMDAREKIKSQDELILKMTENQKLQVKLDTIRDDIARDLHDEVGSTLSSISMYSEAMQQSLNSGEYGKVHEMIGQVGQNSRETMDIMKEIIWTINTKNEQLGDLVDRMQTHTATVLSTQGIAHDFYSSNDFNKHSLSIEFRKNLLLFYKESINNISKHSKAERVNIKLEIVGEKIQLSIRDNGVGFDTTKRFDGNGLQSMKNRAAEMNGTVNITSQLNKGTTIEFISGDILSK